MTELQTDRLQLRPFRPDDFEAHAEICADPEVMRYIRAGALPRVDAWWQMARYMGHWQAQGLRFVGGHRATHRTASWGVSAF